MATDALADLEALTLGCRSEQSKVFVAEAVLCYRSGAFRAAIVSAWIAVVFDLIDKIRELSLAGDGGARELEERFQTYVSQINHGNSQGVSNALEFEREILDLCSAKLQFFDEQQLIDLRRLREDRHRCAHPSFQQASIPYAPSAEQARLHIRNAVSHVLSQPPVQGKAALAGFNRLVSSAYFPLDTEQALLQFRRSEVGSATRPLIHAAVDSLVFGFLTPGHALFEKRQVIPALNALHRLHPGHVEDRVRMQLSKSIRDIEDDRFEWSLYLAVKVDFGWRSLDEPARNKVVRFIEVGAYERLSAAASELVRIERLRLAFEARIGGFDLDQLAGIIRVAGLAEAIKKRSIDLLSLSRSWDRTNALFDKAILPIFQSLLVADVERIIGLWREARADIPGAFGFSLFIEKVREAGLLEGRLDELLRESGAAHLVVQPEGQ